MSRERLPSDDTLDALSSRFGDLAHIASSPLPFFMGGPASIAVFDVEGGQLGVTFELSGDGGQLGNETGPYEIAIAAPEPADAQFSLISRLAGYSFAAVIESGHTVHLPRDQQPSRSKLAGLLFSQIADLDAAGRRFGVLLAIGLRHDELDAVRFSDDGEVLERLTADREFPFTEWKRRSVLGRR